MGICTHMYMPLWSLPFTFLECFLVTFGKRMNKHITSITFTRRFPALLRISSLPPFCLICSRSVFIIIQTTSCLSLPEIHQVGSHFLVLQTEFPQLVLELYNLHKLSTKLLVYLFAVSLSVCLCISLSLH